MSLSTSVKLNEEDKRKLERLQALVTIRTAKKITQQDILSELIKSASERGDQFVDTVFGETVPMSDEAYERLLALTGDWKIRTSSDQIDSLVYGETGKRKRRTTAKRTSSLRGRGS